MECLLIDSHQRDDLQVDALHPAQYAVPLCVVGNEKLERRPTVAALSFGAREKDASGQGGLRHPFASESGDVTGDMEGEGGRSCRARRFSAQTGEAGLHVWWWSG
jgi:hypothetical protein